MQLTWKAATSPHVTDSNPTRLPLLRKHNTQYDAHMPQGVILTPLVRIRWRKAENPMWRRTSGAGSTHSTAERRGCHSSEWPLTATCSPTCGLMPALFRYIGHPDTAKCPPYPLEKPSCARAAECPSVFQERKEYIRTLLPAHTKSQKHTFKHNGESRWASGIRSKRPWKPQIDGAFPFCRKILPLRKRARTAPPTFFTPCHEDRI